MGCEVGACLLAQPNDFFLTHCQRVSLLNVTFSYRAHVTLPAPEPFDFCFIDGDHSYVGVRRDYVSFSSSCRSMMFHDVQDVSTLHLGNFSGGVPMFWAHLVDTTHRQFRNVQSATARASFKHTPSFTLLLKHGRSSTTAA